MKTINSVIKPEEREFSEAVNAFLPRYALVPFSQSVEKKYRCTVAAGDRVQEGQIVAVPFKVDSGDIDVAVHASIPGLVTGIEECSLPNGRVGQAVKIQLEGSFSHLGRKAERRDWKSLALEEILKIFLTKGVINTFNESHSLTQQILSCKLKHGRFLVVRMFDEDPSRMTDSFIAKHYTASVTEGAAIVAKAMNAEGIIFLVPKRSNIQIDNDLVKEFAVLTVTVDEHKYPSGFVANIIPLVKRQVKGSRNDFFEGISHRCIFVDTPTLLSVYEAVVLGIPVTERFVHVTGSCLRAAAMFRVKIGTTLEMLASQCGGFKHEPAKIIVNGMVTGSAVSSMNLPVSKNIKSVSFVPANELFNQTYASCIRCGKCRNVCPEGLYPDLIAGGIIHGASIDKNLAGTAMLCSGCCLCNSVCPSRLPLSQAIAIIRNNENEIK